MPGEHTVDPHVDVRDVPRDPGVVLTDRVAQVVEVAAHRVGIEDQSLDEADGPLGGAPGEPQQRA